MLHFSGEKLFHTKEISFPCSKVILYDRRDEIFREVLIVKLDVLDHKRFNPNQGDTIS